MVKSEKLFLSQLVGTLIIFFIIGGASFLVFAPYVEESRSGTITCLWAASTSIVIFFFLLIFFKVTERIRLW